MAAKKWWEALQLRPEIVDADGRIDDVQMSLGEAVHTTKGATPVPYADAAYYGDITEPTTRLTALLSNIAVRLFGGDNFAKAGALTRLNQGMGGGKSHALIGAWHLAAHPQGFFATDIGQAVRREAEAKLGQPLPDPVNPPVVVVLDLDNSTPGVGRKEVDGPDARTLYEKFLWRLFGGDANLFNQYRDNWSDKATLKEALAHSGRPVLVVVDEIMDYVGNGLSGAADDTLKSHDMAFLRALLDSINDVPNAAMLVAMIDPEKDRISLSPDGKERQGDLHSLLDRNGTSATVNDDTDFSAILKRRLFTAPPTPAQAKTAADAYTSVMADPGWAQVYARLEAPWTANWDKEVTRSYPFHPQLMHLAEQEWAKKSGFQNVRSTIRVFAATVYALQQRGQAGGWVPTLIGPGDLPLSNNEVREAILGSGLISDTSLEANYRSIIQGDITNTAGTAEPSGQARLLDNTVNPTEHWGLADPYAHERAATMIAVASLMPRGAGRRGASVPEIKVASNLPDITYSVGDADGVIERLTNINSERAMGSAERIEGVGGQPPRFYLNPETGAKVIYRQHRQAINPVDRDNAIAERTKALAKTGPFDEYVFVDAQRDLPTDADRVQAATATLLTAGVDDARKNRLVILDPAGFSLRNGMDAATKGAVEAVSGIGPDAATVTWASSAVYAVVNTQRRRNAREAASDYLAWERTANSPELQGNENAQRTAREEATRARGDLDKFLRKAFQHILYVSQPTPNTPKTIAEITLDQDVLTALDGTTVWKELAEKGKAFEESRFDAKVLLLHLRDSDYQKPLRELRDAFYQTPRLPLLPHTTRLLQETIFAAVNSGDLRLVNAEGVDVAITEPAQINLSAEGLRLAKPIQLPPVCDKCGKADCDGDCDPTEACPKCGKPDCDGNCKQPCPKCGKTDCPGDCDPPPPPCTNCGKPGCPGTCTPTRANVKFSHVGQVDETNREHLVDVLQSVLDAVMDGKVTYLSTTVQLIATTGAAESIQTAAEPSAITVTVKQQP